MEKKGKTHDSFTTFITPTNILVTQSVKNLPIVEETQARFLGWEDPIEKEMATHSSVLAWKFPWTEVITWLSCTDHVAIMH